jgi:hypothetical protein
MLYSAVFSLSVSISVFIGVFILFDPCLVETQALGIYFTYKHRPPVATFLRH